MIDFHCHLDLYPDPQLAAEDADRAGVYVLSVTTTPKAWKGTLKLAEGPRRIRTSLGLHPQLAHLRHNELPLFESLGGETLYFGEVGLDGGSELARHADIQREVFDFILKVAGNRGGKVLTIHSRRAATAVLDSLQRHPDAGIPILHWFSGSAGELRRAISLGCWFSVGPAMLRTARGRELASLMPRHRILTETDGPFAKDKTRPLQPADAWVAVDQLAAIWGVERDEASHQLADNLRRLTEPFR